MSDQQAVLDYWLKTLEPKTWYVADPAVDAEIARRFTGLWQRALDGGLTDWLETATGALAYLIVTDQFSRNMFRGDARAFATDAKARAAARAALERGFDRAVKEPERLFFYMPFEHSEDPADQAFSVELTRSRLPGSAADSTLHARAHQEIIRRFGRFPFRNAALGRVTTSEEQAFLDAGGYGATVRALGG